MILQLPPGCWQPSWAFTSQIPQVSSRGSPRAGADSSRGSASPGALSAWLFQLPSRPSTPQYGVSCSGFPHRRGPICSTFPNRS
eukprot:709151-Lingulodinium_polyedra.AAC.1